MTTIVRVGVRFSNERYANGVLPLILAICGIRDIPSLHFAVRRGNGAGLPWERDSHPATFAPPEAVGTEVAGNGGNRSSQCQRLEKRVSEQTGPNMSEHRASLERIFPQANFVRFGGPAGFMR